MPIVLNGSGPVTGVTSLNTTVSDTEIGYLDGVTSALQTQINTAGGLVKITDATFSAQSTVSVNNCFSSSYDNYRIIWNLTPTTANDVNIRLRASGTDNTSNQYLNGRFYVGLSSNIVFTSTNNSTQSSGLVSYPENVGDACLEVFRPFASHRTQIMASSAGGLTMISGVQMTVTTSYDGFTIFTSSGTITGTLRVYGYRN